MCSGGRAVASTGGSSGRWIARASRCRPLPGRPYRLSPATGVPSSAQCTRIWCVRPVLGRNSIQVAPLARPSTCQSVAASWPQRSTTMCQPRGLVTRRNGAVTVPRSPGDVTFDHRPIGLSCAAGREHPLRLEQRCPPQGDDKAARGIRIQPMRQPGPALPARQDPEPIFDAASAGRAGVNR